MNKITLKRNGGNDLKKRAYQITIGEADSRLLGLRRTDHALVFIVEGVLRVGFNAEKQQESVILFLLNRRLNEGAS